MKVTSLQPQKNNPERFSIFVDGRYALSLSSNDLLVAGLAEGDELTPDRLAELESQSGLSKLYDKALNFISFRPRSRQEVADYLKRRKLGQEEIDITLAKLTDNGWLDDTKFAAIWIRDRMSHKLISRRQLIQELRQKGIAPEIAAQQLDALSQDAERANLRKLIDKKRRSYDDPAKLTKYLLSRGFDYDLIKTELSD